MNDKLAGLATTVLHGGMYNKSPTINAKKHSFLKERGEQLIQPSLSSSGVSRWSGEVEQKKYLTDITPITIDTDTPVHEGWKRKYPRLCC